jgi:hypothetical protein
VYVIRTGINHSLYDYIVNDLFYTILKSPNDMLNIKRD